MPWERQISQGSGPVRGVCAG